MEVKGRQRSSLTGASLRYSARTSSTFDSLSTRSLLSWSSTNTHSSPLPARLAERRSQLRQHPRPFGGLICLWLSRPFSNPFYLHLPSDDRTRPGRQPYPSKPL